MENVLWYEHDFYIVILEEIKYIFYHGKRAEMQL